MVWMQPLLSGSQICNMPGAEMVTRAVQDSVGLPLAVQLVALPWREELCLHAMCELERAMLVQGRSVFVSVFFPGVLCVGGI